MKIIDLTKEYCASNIFNRFTAHRTIKIAELFVRRAEVEIISEVNKLHIQRFKELTLLNAKPITYNGYLTFLRLIGDYAVSEFLVPKNVFREVKKAKTGKSPSKVLKNQVIESVIELLQSQSKGRPWFWIGVIYTLYYTGIRRLQLVNLKLSDIDFKNDIIFLRYEGSKTKREWEIPLHPALKIELKKYLEFAGMYTNRPITPNDYIFNEVLFYSPHCYEKHNNKRGPLNPDRITTYFGKLSRASGIRIGAHRFRHTLATALCNPEDNSTPDIFAIQNLLGHTNLETTKNYVETSFRRMRGTLGNVGILFSDKSTNLLTS